MPLAIAILPSPGFLPPSPPGEQTTARQDQAGQSGPGDRARYGGHLKVDRGISDPGPSKWKHNVDLHTGSLGVTFMEKLGSGVVQTTTIANGGISVHSRNTVTREGRFLASQYYGVCKVQ
jgi:hypothetical protein